MTRSFAIFFGVSLAVPLTGCSDAAEAEEAGDSGNGGSGASGSSMGGAGAAAGSVAYVGADGVAITQIAIYQGPKRVLAEGGVAIASTIPLVQGRDAMLRVYYTASPERVGSSVVGRLERTGHAPIDQEHVVTAGSSDPDATTTINFFLDGAEIGPELDYRVTIGVEGTSGGNPQATHPLEGTEVHTVEGPPNKLRVIFAPYRYDADGSGRVPDLVADPVRLEAYRSRLEQLYPVSDVEATVRAPIPWSGPIQPNGGGWQEVGFNLFSLRGQDGTPADVYYYGIFNPTASIGQFCQGGCLLGVTLLNNQPPDVGDASLRLALGVGFPEVGPDTAAHELGHAHGREHAPCGPGLDPNSIDASFPYAGAGIGPQAYDVVNQLLVEPAGKTDIMGYCTDQWISDYNYIALLNRGKNVNLPKWQAPLGRASLEVIYVDDDGSGRFLGALEHELPRAEADIHVSLLTTDGHASLVKASYHRMDHLPGGWLVYEKPPFRAAIAEATVGGRFSRIVRASADREAR